MTLTLRLTDLTGLNNATYIYVAGGQSGLLRLDARRFPQTIKCSSHDHLTLWICGKDSELQPRQVISKVDFNAPAVIDANRIKLRQLNEIEYHVRSYDKDDNKLGHLTFLLSYDRKKLYTGQIISADKRKANYLPFYRVKCPSYNLYNCLDGHSRLAKNVWIEDIYRDANYNVLRNNDMH